MRHVYEYYLGGYDKMSLEQALKVIHLRKPYDNLNCRQCHTTTLRGWRSVPDHEALKAELFANKVSCASAGCHGFAHPFDKGEKQLLESQASVAAARSSASAAPSTSASAAPRAP
jgi:cytochrome c-type protein NapC